MGSTNHHDRTMLSSAKTYTLTGLAIIAICIVYNSTLFGPAGFSLDAIASEVTTLPIEFKAHYFLSHTIGEYKNLQ